MAAVHEDYHFFKGKLTNPRQRFPIDYITNLGNYWLQFGYIKPIVTKKSEEEKKKSIKLKNQEINSLCTCHIKKKKENRNSKVATGKLSS